MSRDVKRQAMKKWNYNSPGKRKNAKPDHHHQESRSAPRVKNWNHRPNDE